MRILLIWASADFSIRDVTTGYRAALVRQGHDIRDYRLDRRLIFCGRAFPESQHDIATLSQLASENALVEATKHRAELVLVVSGMGFHPNGLWLLRQHGYRIAVVLTESPYADEPEQVTFASYCDDVFTNEQTSAERYGWGYLPPAFDVDQHQPSPSPSEDCDVLFVGTGWPERQRFFEAVDWTGIRLSLWGLWPDMTAASPLAPYLTAQCLDNADTVRLYGAAAIGVNLHRAHPAAVTPNPRAYELAACGVFQLSDRRAGVADLFGASVPTFDTPEEFGALVRYYLAHPAERDAKRQQARARVQGETFDARAAALMAAIQAGQPAAMAAAG